jgi:hypothetical protein
LVLGSRIGQSAAIQDRLAADRVTKNGADSMGAVEEFQEKPS